MDTEGQLAKMALVASVLARGSPRQRLGALPRLARTARDHPTIRPFVERVLAEHAATLVQEAAALSESAPWVGQAALRALEAALPASWPPGLPPPDFLDVPGVERMRVAAAQAAVERSTTSARTLLRLELAQRLRVAGEHQQALELARLSVAELETSDGRESTRRLAEALNVLAILEIESGADMAALLHAHRSVCLHIEAWNAELRDRQSGAWACLTLGVAYYRGGQDELARRYLTEAKRLGRGLAPERADYPNIEVSAAVTVVTHFPDVDVNVDLGRLHFDPPRVDDRALLASARGFVLTGSGRHADALPHFNEALALRRLELDLAPARPTIQLARVLMQLGSALDALGRQHRSAHAYEEAATLATYPTMRERAVRAASHAHRRAAADASRRDSRLAEDHFKRALDHDATLGDTASRALTMAVGAFVSWDNGDPQPALDRAETSVRLAADAVASGEREDSQVKFAQLTRDSMRREVAKYRDYQLAGSRERDRAPHGSSLPERRIGARRHVAVTPLDGGGTTNAVA